MRIKKIVIEMEPSSNEVTYLPRTLIRDEQKNWYSDGMKGLLPFEVRLAMQLQEIIATFNGDKRNK